MEKIVLGSGNLYTKEYKGDEIPTHEEIETAENLTGLIQGGATLEYKAEHYTAEDDSGVAKKTVLTKEEAMLKTGIMTWNAKTLEKLCSTARVKEEAGKRIVKIGGINNQDGKKYVIRFHHKDPVDGDIRITIVGTNQVGFSLAFAKDKETVIDAEFIALALDKEGTLIIFEEEIKGE